MVVPLNPRIRSIDSEPSQPHRWHCEPKRQRKSGALPAVALRSTQSERRAGAAQPAIGGTPSKRANIRWRVLTPAQRGDTDKCETRARTHCCSTQEAFIQTPSNSQRRRSAAPRFGSYLVDPASSHMLVSKIKPCMSKYKYCTAKLQTAH